MNIRLIIAASRINLYYTDEVSGSDYILPHTCLHVNVESALLAKYYEIARFCLSKLASTYKIEKRDSFPKFTFAELSKQGITSEQLYFWSAPIDLIERYQFYLNQLSIKTGDLSSAENEFYNCTLPNFGPQCQYQLAHDVLSHSSLDESVMDYYRTFVNRPFTLTCYSHLNCDRGSSLICLDWREICDRKIDCLDGGLDEDRCWQLEIHECRENEYRCSNGQCIPKSFYLDRPGESDCLDVSDESHHVTSTEILLCNYTEGPWSKCEDTVAPALTETNEHVEIRAILFAQMMYSNKDPTLSENCASAFQCLMKVPHSEYTPCSDLHGDEEHIEIIESFCPELVYFPNVPVLFGNIYFVYKTSDLRYWINSSSTIPFYICSNQSDADKYFSDYSKIVMDRMVCIHSGSWLFSEIFSYFPTTELHAFTRVHLNEWLRKYHLSFNYNLINCNRSNMYQCVNSSKCISIYRLIDGTNDCPYNDDENITRINTSNIIDFDKSHFKCNNGEYISLSLVQNGICECEITEFPWCTDENLHIQFLKKNIVFQHICDGFVDFELTLVDGKNESDETECQQWQCSNIYTRCNDIWNCPNAADEADCGLPHPLGCPSKWHVCVSPQKNELTCLPIEKLADGNIDCLGATDELGLYKKGTQVFSGPEYSFGMFCCMNSNPPSCIHSFDLCNGYNDCEQGDDEQFCTTNQISPNNSICSSVNRDNASDVENFLCYYHLPARVWRIISFQLDGMTETVEDHVKTIDNTLIPSSSTRQAVGSYRARHCHRGLDIDVRFDSKNNSTTNACFCPSSYYGDQCEYQSQRISLAIKFHAFADFGRIPFAIVVLLIDDSDQRTIHSYEHITYLSSRDCEFKFNRYLLYATQPKDPTKTYSIHIDFYEKTSLKYYGSALLLIEFPFLPVYRLAVIVNIPRIRANKIKSCLINRCDHGKCMTYSNQPENVTFCQCNRGWSGRYCHLPHTCACSSDSLCLGVSADNRSICVCPINKFGPRCLLIDTICQKYQNSTCENNGQCLPNYHQMGFFESSSCICQKNFTGDRCEKADYQLILTFQKDIILPQSIFLHFIEIIRWSITTNFTTRATTFRSIPFEQDSITIYWSEPFHLAFTELSDKKYYLTVVQKSYNRSDIIKRTITSSDRCPSISELFNQTFLQWPLLRRIKYYHLPCQTQSLNLSCFYDETHFCLCYDFEQQRLANCFDFDHQMKFDCFGQSACENGARCLQNKPDCPTKSLCICPPCYYGQQCQFSTSGFHSSLDGILGYHILLHASLTKQPFIVQMSFGLTVIVIAVGLIDGILSLITFKNKTTRKVGCGLYLLFSSVATLLTMTMFGLKFFILLLTQMAVISNRSFLEVQCHSLDFLLRVCLSMNRWLNACVAVERTITTIKGVNFDKKRSRKTAKLVVIILFIIIGGTYIHDSIYRRVIDEENDIDDTKRTWCIISYSSSLQVYNYFIDTVHLFGPFLINLISVVTLIRLKARQQSTIHPHRTYKELVLGQFRELKHLLTAPIVLILLVLPRLVITFISKCMQSPKDAWLFLMGYFISFVPSILTFVVFVLPSEFYKKEFQGAVRKYQIIIQRCLHLDPYGANH